MRRRIVLAGVCAVVAAAPQIAAAERQRGHTTNARVAQVAPNERVLLVTFGDRPDATAASARLGGLGSVRPMLEEIGVWELRPTGTASARAAVLGRQGVVRAEWSLLRTTDALPDVRPAPAPPLPLVALPEPTDPFYVQPAPTQQWSLRQGTWAPGTAAYDRPTIAILDSGIATTHEEWQGGVLVAPYSTLRNIASAEDVATTGHGTHVAGIAAAPANGIGVVGVAPASATGATPGASKVMPVQITDALGRSTDITMMRGITWAVNNGAKVINISSGGPGYSQAFQDVVNWAYKRGVLITASVGNEGLDDNPLNFPAGYDHVIGVGAQCDAIVTAFDCPIAFARARFSNFNQSVDVLAPGVNIASTIPVSVTSRQIVPGYGFKDGTSMASPYVAGVVALIYASHPGITPYQVTRILQTTSSRAAVGRSSSDGWGVVNPLAAVQAPAPVDDLSEPNDDIKLLPQRDNLRVTRAPQRIQARADANDDPVDIYPVILRKGERMRVTVVSGKARMGVLVVRPGLKSLSLRDPRNLDRIEAKLLGSTRRTTPGTRSVVVRATQTGRHYIAVVTVLRGDDYTLKIQRL